MSDLEDDACLRKPLLNAEQLRSLRENCPNCGAHDPTETHLVGSGRMRAFACQSPQPTATVSQAQTQSTLAVHGASEIASETDDKDATIARLTDELNRINPQWQTAKDSIARLERELAEAKIDARAELFYIERADKNRAEARAEKAEARVENYRREVERRDEIIAVEVQLRTHVAERAESWARRWKAAAKHSAVLYPHVARVRKERDTLKEQLRIKNLGSHPNASCEMLAARLVQVEKERDELRDQGDTLFQAWKRELQCNCELRAALERLRPYLSYLSHRPSCRYFEDEMSHCSCGLSAILGPES